MAIAILAIVATFAAPSFTEWLNTTSVKNAARQFVTDVQLAKMKAVSEGIQYRIKFDEGSNSYAIEKGNRSIESDSWTQTGPGRCLSDKASAYYVKGVALTQNCPTNALILHPDGSSGMGSIKMSNGSCTDGGTNCHNRVCERCLTAIRTGRIAFAE
jgi:Tfp pilus assembly protein FimT